MTAISGTRFNSRRQLPVPKTETEGVNLWNLLCKNIGKDLSKISMPVTLNEPLSTLQRLCEELEYSDLIDKAVLAPTPLERLMYCSSFIVNKKKMPLQVGGSLLDLRLWVEQRASKPQTFQPSPWRDLRVHQGGQGLPLRRRTGEP